MKSSYLLALGGGICLVGLVYFAVDLIHDIRLVNHPVPTLRDASRLKAKLTELFESNINIEKICCVDVDDPGVVAEVSDHARSRDPAWFSHLHAKSEDTFVIEKKGDLFFYISKSDREVFGFEVRGNITLLYNSKSIESITYLRKYYLSIDK